VDRRSSAGTPPAHCGIPIGTQISFQGLGGFCTRRFDLRCLRPLDQCRFPFIQLTAVAADLNDSELFMQVSHP
jgi:hypothetical protein